VALELLAEVSPERLTTRRVAEAAGVTQPALFRHFASREEILTAAIDFARTQLETAIAAALPVGAPPRATLHTLAETLFDFTAHYPGLPRLFFYRAAGGEALEAEPAAPLEALVQRLASMVSELLAAAKLPGELDRKRAAELFIATLQGELLRSRLAPSEPGEPRTARAASLMNHWWAGLESGQPTASEALASEPPAESAAGTPLVHLDTRPLLAAGTDPFETIMATLATLAPAGVLSLTVPFKPAPLIAVLEARGFTVELLSEADPVVLVARAPAAPALVDLSELEAPEPLEAVLLATATLTPGGAYLARLPRYPALLLPRLAERDLATTVVSLDPSDASAGVLLHVSLS
jgi:AcrR family transcriptional regulator